MLETLTDLTELRDWLKDAERLAVGLHTDHDPIQMVLTMRNALPAILDELERLQREAASLADVAAGNRSEANLYMKGELAAARAIVAARAHLLDAIASMQPEGDHQPMQHVRAALAALEGSL